MNNLVCTICQQTNHGRGTAVFEVVKSEKESYLITKCDNCGMIYTFYDHDVDLKELYDQNDYSVRDTRNSVFFRIQKWEYNAVIKRIKQICGLNSPTILDFGAGKGLFLYFAKLKGCLVSGVESSKPRAEYAKNYFGLNINTEYYTSGKIFDGKFDVITLFHVLEHLQNPSDLLNNLVQFNLKNGGLLITEVPNFRSWQSSWSGNNWLHLDVPRHLNHFTDASLQSLVRKSGCRIIKKRYFSAHLGIIGMVQCIFSWFGYKGFLIAELKQKKSFLLLAKISIILPFAILLESLAGAFGKGGVIRYYSLYEPQDETNEHADLKYKV